LVAFLGRGGFGEVWKARGPGGYHVALKFIRLGQAAGDTELRALELMKEVRHAHLLTTFGAWQRDGMLITAMELTDGTLLDRLRRAQAEGQPGIPAPELLEYMREAAKGLDFLNEFGGPGRASGIQHKDVKPQNLLLVGATVKVGDFGLAKVLEHTATAASGSMTPAYAAPEFFNGQATRWSDQYCLAVAYCELRGGRLPFGGNQFQVMAGHTTRPPDLSMLPEAERPAVARALAKKPEERWPSCRAFAEALAEAGNTALPTPTPNKADPDAGPRPEGEALLARHHREALERTHGQPTPADRDALARLCAQQTIPPERAAAVAREVRGRWKAEHPGHPAAEKTLQALPASVTRGLPPPVTSPPPTVLAPPRPVRDRRGSPPLPWLLAVVMPLAAAAVLGLILLAALYRGPAGEQRETHIASTGPGGASTTVAVVRDTGRPPVPLTTGRDTVAATHKEVVKPPSPPTQEKAEVPRPAPLDCTGADGVSAADVRQAQQAWAKHLGRKVEETVEIADGVTMTFVLVPPARFRMGSPEDEKGDDKVETLHEVTLTEPFDLGETEVTQAQYQVLTGNNPSKFKGVNLPVDQVSWDEAHDYAARLTAKRRDSHLYRLPTEAEWEYACRGGRPSSQPFGVGDGTSLSSREANFNGDYPYGGADKGPNVKATCRAGSYPVNALGLYDTHGNVWEWCADWYAPYPPGDATNPAGPSEGSYRVFRGGGWHDDAGRCRAAKRNGFGPGGRLDDVGFRLARSIPSGGK
jgi:formylglycine-generating enzyme required for sulfatase activity